MFGSPSKHSCSPFGWSSALFGCARKGTSLWELRASVRHAGDGTEVAWRNCSSRSGGDDRCMQAIGATIGGPPHQWTIGEATLLAGCKGSVDTGCRPVFSQVLRTQVQKQGDSVARPRLNLRRARKKRTPEVWATLSFQLRALRPLE